MWSLLYYFVQHSLCYKLVKTGSKYYFSSQSYGINFETVKTSNLKADNNEKMAIIMRNWHFKKKNHISTSSKQNFKETQLLEKSSRTMSKTNILKQSCSKNDVLMKTKITLF